MSREGRDALLAVAIIALAWGVLYALRPSHVVEGSIADTFYRHYPWQIGPRFDLDVATSADRPLLFQGLQGECSGPQRQFSRCSKPELPQGAPIKLVVHGFIGPNECLWPPWPLTDTRRLGSCLHGMDRIGSIEVDGHLVTTGWANSSTYLLLYLLVAGSIVTLALNQWHVTRMSMRTLMVYAFIGGTLYWGFAYY